MLAQDPFPLSRTKDKNNKIINEKGVSEEQGKIHAQIMEGIYETISSREKKGPFERNRYFPLLASQERSTETKACSLEQKTESDRF